MSHFRMFLLTWVGRWSSDPTVFTTINSHDFVKNDEECVNKTNEYLSLSPILYGLDQWALRMSLVPFMGKITIFGSSNE